MLRLISAQIFAYCVVFVRDGMFLSSDKKSSTCFAEINIRRLTIGTELNKGNMQPWYFIFVVGIETQFR